MSRRAKDLKPIEPYKEIPGVPDKEFNEGLTPTGRKIKNSKKSTKEAILKEMDRHKKTMASKKDTEQREINKEIFTGFNNAEKQKAGRDIAEAIDAGSEEPIKPKVPQSVEDDPELLELFESLKPDDLDIGISAQRIARARLICRSLDKYSREEKQLLVYPVIYQLHLYGYHRAEIAAIMGIKPETVRVYIMECRGIYKDELIKEYTSEDRVAESLQLYDFIKKEALRKAETHKGIEDKSASFLRLAAQVESERNKLLETTGYFEKVKRANLLEALEDNDPATASRNNIIADIRDVFTTDVSDL
jgi:DNA-directed RNA polymerase specialized sigma24 family protein